MNAKIDQTTQLNDLLDHARTLQADKIDYKGKASEFYFAGNGNVGYRSDANMFGVNATINAPETTPTEHAIRQACERLGAAYGETNLPFNHMMQVKQYAPDFWAAHMNDALGRLPADRSLLVRTYQETCRAILSGGYITELDNTPLLEMIDTIVSNDATPHRISTRSWVDVDNMCVDILFHDVNTGRGNGNGQFSTGIRIRNGETGKWKGGVYPIAKRTSCDNSISVDLPGLSYEFRHFGGKTIAAKRVMIKSAMIEILPFAATIIEKMIEAEEKELPSFSEIVYGMGIKHGWSESVVGSVFAGSEGQYTVAGLSNGVTWAAHTQQIAPEQMTDMEFLGGALLFDDRGSLMSEAVSIHRSRTAQEQAREAREARRNNR